jgi:IclR family pca regulon transcriptional regulator
MSNNPPIDRQHLIEGLGKGLRLLECFSDENPQLTATEAGRLAGLSRTAARRYLLSLVHFGYAATDGKRYWLKPRVLRIGQVYLESARLPRLVYPFLQRLSAQTGETANLSVLDGHEVVYLARGNAPRGLSIGFHTGARLPAHCAAPGVLLLGALSDDALEAWLQAHEFTRFTEHTETQAEQYRQSVFCARIKGYGFTDQFINLGISGLAVPLTNRRGHCVAALSLTFQRDLYPADLALSKLLPALKETAEVLRPLL